MSVVTLCTVWNGDKVSYLSVPLGYLNMWQKKSKLELALRSPAGYANFTAKIMSSSFVTAVYTNRTWYPSLMNIESGSDWQCKVDSVML